MLLKKGSKGESVKILQKFLGIKIDGDFGIKTERAVKVFQRSMNLKPDGIVGVITWRALELASTDLQENSFTTKDGLVIIIKHMDPDEYLGETKKDYVFFHHTGGWDNPEKTVKDWNDDNRGTIGTEFVVGGQSIRNRKDYDGVVVQAFPEGHYAWHLGTVGKRAVHTDSVGIELNSFGQLKNGRTWTGSRVSRKQICTLNKPFRGFTQFHKYSDVQLENAKLTALHVANRDNIDIRDGLIALIKKEGVKAFEWKREAYYGQVKGLWTHTNVRTDKFDCFPQPEFIDMLLSI